MSTVRVGFFIAISITFCLTSVTYCHPNESGINRYQSQKLSRLLKRETLADVYHSLEAFENDEELLPNNSQTPFKRSTFIRDSLKPNFNCKCKPGEKGKEEEKKSEPEKTSESEKTSKPKKTSEPEKTSKPEKPSEEATVGIYDRVGNTSIPRFNTSAQTDSVPSNKSCLPDIFRDTDKFFESVNTNLQSLSNELSKIFKSLDNKTADLLSSTKFTNTDLFDTNKCKVAKNSSNIFALISEFKRNLTSMIPTTLLISSELSPMKNYDNVSAKISTFIGNIKNNVTDFSARMRASITGDNVFSNFLKQINDAVNPVKNYNFTILDTIREKIITNNGTRNQTSIIERLIRQNAALGILGQFLNKFSRGISGFFHVISRKWSHEDKHPHHHGLVGSIKDMLGWPSHVHREPNWFHKMFSLPNLHWKHHDEHVPLLKKILKIPDHHHHRHPGSIIKHLLNSLYSVFHLSNHCECPQGSNSATSCPANCFFNWLGGKPTPHHHHHHKHAPGHINLHHNIMKHKQPACSCS